MEYYQYKSELSHHGIKGQKWGIRRFQNKDGTLTNEGRERYNEDEDTYESDSTINSENKHNKVRKGFIIGGAIAATAAAAAGATWYLTRKKKEEELAKTKDMYKDAMVKAHNYGKKLGYNEAAQKYKNAIVKSHNYGKRIGFDDGARTYKNVIYTKLKDTPSGKTGFGINWLRKIQNTVIRWD